MHNTTPPQGFLCRFATDALSPRVGLVPIIQDAPADRVIDLTPSGVNKLACVTEANPVALPVQAELCSLPTFPLNQVRLLAPVDDQEVWAAGVTYLRSKTARMEESDFSASAYDRVYGAARPELFFKSLPQKVVADDDHVGIRRDSRWNVPEPELALWINSRAECIGLTIGNDMSSRDIEGENLLYLPQAKTYSRSCAIGPWIRLGVSENEARSWPIRLIIERGGEPVFEGSTVISQIKRTFHDLIEHLFRCQEFPHGVVLLTGTGIIPPDSFSLQAGDVVSIHIPNIGTLKNAVCQV